MFYKNDLDQINAVVGEYVFYPIRLGLDIVLTDEVI